MLRHMYFGKTHRGILMNVYIFSLLLLYLSWSCSSM